ncbi:hypothetical protein ACIBQ1_09925 [Nonomuraea sp. NPDC050153]|uniref:hypothetical protein n=1 Tax=Nonomuraea sp. NPDC050153 TaxID=3364359 RepID=UPI0037BD195F
MPVNEKLMELGSWTLTLVEETPKTILDQLAYFGHIAFVPGRLEPSQYGDQLLTMARYVGVLTGRDVDHIRKTIDGQGMALWLSDGDDKGDLLETPVQITGQTFANAIRAILGSGTAVVEGTLYSGIAGVYTGRHVYQSRRKAINFIATTMGGEWRVNGDGTLDAGPATSLYSATPDTVIVRRRPNRHTDGDDLNLHGLRGDMGVATDVDDWTTRLVLLAEGEGDAIATAAADNPANPYKDLRGQPVKRVRVISESTTAPGNAQARANYQLAKFISPRTSMRLTTDDYDVVGAFAVGDWAWVYAPDEGLVDPGVEITFRGERINPIKLRMVGASWPIRRGMTVAYRNKDGGWLDLTPYVDWEGGETTVTVGDLLRALSESGVEPVGPRPIPDSTIPGVVSWDLPFETGVYVGSDGSTRAKMLVKWLLPLNVDGSTILDGDHYEVQFAPSPAGTEWQTAYAPWGSLQTMIVDLTPGIDYDFRIRAVDSSNNQGAWSTVQTEQTNADTIAPSTPAPPTVAGSRLAIQITHTLGKASGGTYNLELDLDHFEVHVGSSSGFTPDNTTLRGKVLANAGMIHANIPAVGTVDVEETTTRYVKVIAVDIAGNASSPSTAATATALLIDDAHITDLTVSKVTAGTISANWLIGASIRTASSGQRVELNATGLHGFNGAGTELVTLSNTGSFILKSAGSGARTELDATNGFRAFNSGGVQTVALTTSGTFTLQTGTSGARTVFDANGFAAYNSSSQPTVDIDAGTGDVTLVGQIATGFSGKRMIFNPTGASFPEIRFTPTTGTQVAKIVATSDTTTDYIGVTMESGVTSGLYSKLSLWPNTARLDHIRTSDNFGGAFVAQDGGATIQFYTSGSLLERSVILNNAGVHIFSSSGVVNVNGSSYKSFVIDHPIDSDRYLVHACTESPAPGVEYWGEVELDADGRAIVELPGYFEALTRPDGRYVSVNTCSDEIRNASATYPTDGRFTIHGGPGLRVAWLVKAIRSDAGDMLVEPRRDEVTVRGDGPYRYYTRRETRA